MGIILFTLGMPVVSSFSEAEAQCVFLTKKGLAEGVISEDLDNLAFGANLLIR
jgi:5'-3' exonuclease